MTILNVRPLAVSPEGIRLHSAFATHIAEQGALSPDLDDRRQELVKACSDMGLAGPPELLKVLRAGASAVSQQHPEQAVETAIFTEALKDFGPGEHEFFVRSDDLTTLPNMQLLSIATMARLAVTAARSLPKGPRQTMVSLSGLPISIAVPSQQKYREMAGPVQEQTDRATLHWPFPHWIYKKLSGAHGAPDRARILFAEVSKRQLPWEPVLVEAAEFTMPGLGKHLSEIADELCPYEENREVSEYQRCQAVLKWIEKNAPAETRVLWRSAFIFSLGAAFEPQAVEATQECRLHKTAKGEGLGYDLIVGPAGDARTFGEMREGEKTIFSPRGMGLFEVGEMLSRQQGNAKLNLVYSLLAQRDADPQLIMDALCEHFEFFRTRFQNGDNTGNETLAKHTVSVQRKLEVWLNSDPELKKNLQGWLPLLRLAVVLHDSGKPASIRRDGNGTNQKRDTEAFNDHVFRVLRVRPDEQRFIKALIKGGVASGVYGPYEPDWQVHINKIVAACPTGIPEHLFLTMVTMFTVADSSFYANVMAASYMDAKNADDQNKAGLRIHPADRLACLLGKLQERFPTIPLKGLVGESADDPAQMLPTVKAFRYGHRHKDGFSYVTPMGAGEELDSFWAKKVLPKYRIETVLTLDLRGTAAPDAETLRAQIPEGKRVVLVGAANTVVEAEALKALAAELNVACMLVAPVALLAPDQPLVPRFDFHRFINDDDPTKVGAVLEEMGQVLGKQQLP